MSPLDFLLNHKRHLESRISIFKESTIQAEMELEAVTQLISKEEEADSNIP